MRAHPSEKIKSQTAMNAVDRQHQRCNDTESRWSAQDRLYNGGFRDPLLFLALAGHPEDIAHHTSTLRAQLDPGKQPEGEQLEQSGINWDVVTTQFALFRKMALPYFREEKSARMLLAVVIAFTLLNSAVSVGFSYLSKDFYNALNSKNTEAFYPTLRMYALALTGGTPVAVLYKFYREKLAVQWRAWMTQRILDMYEANRSYYALEMKGEIDNPDQRIAEDARAFTRVSLDFSITLLTSVIDLISFAGILYSIYPQLFGAIIACIFCHFDHCTLDCARMPACTCR